MNLPLILNLLVFVALLLGLAQTRRTNWSLAKKVLFALVLGVAFGVALHSIYGAGNPVLKASIGWFDLVGNGYVQLLQMIVIPLVFASILSAVARLHNAASLGKISFLTIGTLLFTTAIAALIGIGLTNLFGLTAEGLVAGTQEMARLQVIQSDYAGKVADLNIIDTLQAWVMRLVRLVMKLTPYGVLALMTKVVAGSNLQDIIKLGSFVVVSYLALGLMFVVHGLLLSLAGINPLRFFRKVWPVLTFAFTSRSSAAAIPLSIEAQTRRLGIPQSIAGFAASFGATIGQNGCAGLYPAMLAVMVAPTVGINPLDPLWIATLVAIVTLSSAGVAGVGGGATFAALIVLPAMGLPVSLVALLISVEPLIDMGRTALNVNGSMTAGAITSQIMGQTDKAMLDADEHAELAQA